MKTKWQHFTRSFVAAALAGSALAGLAQAAEEATAAQRQRLTFTLIAGRAGEPGQLGLRLAGAEAATLDAWLDFDGDGFFDEGGERILDQAGVAPGISVHSFELPEGAAVSASSRLRLRLSGADGALLEERESLAFPERLIDLGCNWAPGFGTEGFNNTVLALEVLGDSLYAGGDFTAVNGLAVRQVARWDGGGWSAVGNTNFGRVQALETFNDGTGSQLYAATTLSPYLYRWTGQAWAAVTGMPAGSAVHALRAWDNGQGEALYVGGAFTSVSNLGSAGRNLARLNGGTWQTVGGGLAALQVRSLAVTGSGAAARLMAGGIGAVTTVSRLDGASWTGLGNPGGQVESLVDFGGLLHAGGPFGVRRWVNGGWQGFGFLNQQVHALAVFDAGQGPALYAAGAGADGNSGRLARWNGTGWTLLTTVMDAPAWALATHQEAGAAPALFVGGNFTATSSAAGGASADLAAPRIARFDAGGFSSLASGMNNAVGALAVDEDSGEVFAGGAFTQAGGLQVAGFARWNGHWNAVGTGLLPTDFPTDIQLVGEPGARTLYVASDGDHSGALHQLQLGVFEPLASLDETAFAVAEFGGRLYLGGQDVIEPAGNPAGNRLAVSNGSGWVQVGTTTPITEDVTALEVFDFGQGPRLVVGGIFTNRVAVWDGSSWSTLGSPPGNVQELAVHDDGRGGGPKLYAAGDNFVARWDGSNWTRIATFSNGFVRALASFSDGSRRLLAAGGKFGFINLSPFVLATNLAVWDGQSWSAVGSGTDNEVDALAAAPAADGNRLYVGGYFMTAGGLASRYIARLECPAAPAEFDAALAMSSPTTIAAPNGLVHYEIQVANHGPDPANGVRVEDDFPAGYSSCSWTATASPGVSGFQNGGGLSLRQTLSLPAATQLVYQVDCQVAGAAAGQLVNQARLVAADTNPYNQEALVTHVIVPSGPQVAPGDCDHDGQVNAADFAAFHAEIFDGDGAYPEFTPASTFQGHPRGCNANSDRTVDAGDLSCLALSFVPRPCTTDPLPAAGGVPILDLSDLLLVTGGDRVAAEIKLYPKGQQVNSVAFALTWDPEKLMLPDQAGVLAWNPAAGSPFSRIDRAASRIEVAIRLGPDQQLPEAVLLTVQFRKAPQHVGDTVQRGVVFAAEPAASFGTIRGQSVLGLATMTRALVRTLVLTHTSRLFDNAELGFGIDQQVQLRGLLEAFLDHDRVRGMLVDLAADSDLRYLYDAWQQSGDPAKANQVLFGDGQRRGLQRLVLQLRQAFPNVENLLLVGDDRIVPFARLEDHAGAEDPDPLTEADYIGSGGVAGLPASNDSTVKRALAADYFLSDDPLAANEELAADLDSDAFVLPGLGVGRLVENAGEILGAFATFLEWDGLVDLDGFAPQERQVLVTGYDFLTDGAREIGATWQTALGAGSPAVDDDWIGPGWDGDDLFDVLAGSHGARIYSLNGHATHELIGAPGPQFSMLRGLPALEIYGPDRCGNDPAEDPVDLGGALFIGLGCHGGLPVPGTCAAGPVGQAHTLDLPQTLLARGALAYGDNTGFGWGLLQGTGLGERLALQIQRRMAGLVFPASQRTTLGAAVRQAKTDYYLQQLDFDRFDRKTLMQWSLYGFPMVELGMPQTTAAPPAAAGGRPQFGPPDASGTRRAELGGVRYELRRAVAGGDEPELPPHLTVSLYNVSFPAEDFQRVELAGEGDDGEPCPAGGCYWKLKGLATDEVDLPVQPYHSFDPTALNSVQRGVLWKGARYVVDSDFRPVVATPVSSREVPPSTVPTSLPLRTIQHPTGPNGGGYLGGPLGCAGNSGSRSQIVLLTGELKRVGEGGWEERLYHNVDLEVLERSVSAVDCQPPVFGDGPFDQEVDGELRWRVPVSDPAAPMAPASGVWKVIVLWDDEPAQRWRSIELTRSGDFWEGSLPADPRRTSVTYLLEAVDREGNVAWWERPVELLQLTRNLIEPIERQLRGGSLPPAPLFADGFESGDTTGWSTVLGLVP